MIFLSLSKKSQRLIRGGRSGTLFRLEGVCNGLLKCQMSDFYIKNFFGDFAHAFFKGRRRPCRRLLIELMVLEHCVDP